MSRPRSTSAFVFRSAIFAVCVFRLAECGLDARQPELREIKKVGDFFGSGFVEDIQPGEITIRKDGGSHAPFLIQNKDERFLSLDGNDYIVPMPSRILVHGKLPCQLLERGMIVRFQGEVNRAGRAGQPVTELQVLSGDSSLLRIQPVREPEGTDFVPCEFVGIIQRFENQNMYLVVPKSRLTPMERISVRVADDALFSIQTDNLNRVRDGDRIVAFTGDTMANGALVIRNIEVELTANREIATPSFSDQLYLKHSRLSDSPLAPRREVSDHFVLHTDISPRSAKVLLEKLEAMYGFLARYYHKKPRDPIECYVVGDLDNFRSSIPAIATTKIAQRAGVTDSRQFALISGNRVKGKQTKAIVYACDDHAIVQHEAVHAWCSMTFGTVGPVWYAEGMAEIGQYWVPEKNAIQIDPVVIEYLTTSGKKKMLDIVAAGQLTGDSWKAYAWRWALCHLLMHNPNYADRFRQLGINMMAEKHDSFDLAFGDLADRISFEYDQFVRNFGNGYRVDLCVWQWRDEVEEIESRVGINVLANQGWQASGLHLMGGEPCDFVCPKLPDADGVRQPQTWTVSNTGRAVSPDGNARGDGKLVGAILNGYQLSEPFEIGLRTNGFRPAVSGQLYLRCQENWNMIDDNAGQIRVYIRKTPQGQ